MKPSPFKPFQLTKGLTLLTLILALLITYKLFNTAQTKSDQKTQAYFDYRVGEIIGHITGRMRGYEALLRSTSSYFNASESVERDEFNQYVSEINMTDYYASIRQLGYVELVHHPEKNRHVAAVRSSGLPQYSISPAGQRPIYAPVVFLKSTDSKDLAMHGFDLRSQPLALEAMERSILTGEPTLTNKKLLLPQTSQSPTGSFMMVMPVYRNASKVYTLADRRESVLGWVYLAFSMDGLMQGLSANRADDLDVHIYDNAIASKASLLFDSQPNLPPNQLIHSAHQIKFVDRTWLLSFGASPLMTKYVDHAYANSIGIFGVLISVLLSLMVHLLGGRQERAIQAAKLLSQEILVEQQRLSNVIEGTNVGTWEWCVHTGVVFFNERWAAIIGYELGELEPISIKTWYQFVHPEDGVLSSALLKKHFAGEIDYYECEVRMRHKDGHWVWVLDRGKVMSRSPEGKPLLMSGTHQDISERKQAETELTRAKQIAEQALLAERDLMHMLTHELGTSLSVMRMALDILKPKAAIKQHLSQALADMHDIIERVDQMNQLEHKQWTLLTEACDIAAMVNVIKSDSLLNHRFFIEQQAVPDVHSDKLLLQIILNNVIHNAFKYAAAESVVEVSISPFEQQGKMGVLVCVMNQVGASGLPDPDRLFEKYYRSPGAYGVTGSGLGLYLAHSMIGLLGGWIVYDVVQKKVRFTLWIPC